jgi:hypothetical protein
MARLFPASVGDDPFAHAEGAAVSPEFERACVEFFADVVQVFGVPRSVGQIYGLLYASPQPLSFTAIAGKLDISRGSTSQGLQALRDLGAVVPVSGTEGEREGEGKREKGEGARQISSVRILRRRQVKDRQFPCSFQTSHQTHDRLIEEQPVRLLVRCLPPHRHGLFRAR